MLKEKLLKILNDKLGWVLCLCLVACASMPLRDFPVRLYVIDWEERCISRNTDIEGEVEERCFSEDDDLSEIVAMPLGDWANELEYTDVTIPQFCKKWK